MNQFFAFNDLLKKHKNKIFIPLILIFITVYGMAHEDPVQTEQATPVYTTAVPDDFDATNRAHTLGLLIGYEEACGLKYDKSILAMGVTGLGITHGIDTSALITDDYDYAHKVVARLPYMHKEALRQACTTVKTSAMKMDGLLID